MARNRFISIFTVAPDGFLDFELQTFADGCLLSYSRAVNKCGTCDTLEFICV